MTEKDFGPEDVEVLNRTKTHDGFIKIENLKIRHRLFDGGWSEEFERELILRPPAVGVLLFDPALDKVVMVRQFRVGMLDEESDPWPLELVAGMVDKNETHKEVASRECQEEANILPKDLIHICDYYNSPGTSNERVILYCGRVDAADAGGVFGLREEHEDIAVVAVALDEALAALEQGRINNAMSIIALQWLRINKEFLRVEWA